MPDVRIAGAAAALILALSGCADPIPRAQEHEMNDERETETRLPGQSKSPEPAAPATGANTESGIRSAVVADLSTRLGVAEDTISVQRFQPMTWNDGSMGCPEPNTGYTQALVPGYWIILEHEGRHYDYRASRRGHFVACKNPPAKPGGRAGAADA